MIQTVGPINVAEDMENHLVQSRDPAVVDTPGKAVPASNEVVAQPSHQLYKKGSKRPVVSLDVVPAPQPANKKERLVSLSVILDSTAATKEISSASMRPSTSGKGLAGATKTAAPSRKVPKMTGPRISIRKRQDTKSHRRYHSQHGSTVLLVTIVLNIEVVILVSKLQISLVLFSLI
jgi:hypothetical protein